MKVSKWFLALALLCLIPLAMARDKGYSSRTNNSSADMYHSAVITFDKGEHQLSSSDMERLRSAVKSAKAKGDIKKLEVAAWSDQEHPTTGDLSKSSRELAERRLNAVKKGLRQDVGKMKYIGSFNMAESANWLARFFNTSEAELDAVFAKKEEGALERQDFAIIKREGGPSKAVVILKVEHKNGTRSNGMRTNGNNRK